MKRDVVITQLVMIFISIGVLYFGYKGVTKITQSGNPTGVTAGEISINEKYAASLQDDKDANKLLEKGVRHTKMNLDDLAILDFTRATEIEPNFRDAWIWRGYIHIENENYEEAIRSLKEAESIDPIYPDTFRFLAYAYQKNGQDQKAQTANEKYQYLIKK